MKFKKFISLFTMVVIFINSPIATAIDIALQTPTQMSEQAVSLLNQLPYYGDISKCKLTQEMAKAYAEVLKNMPENGEYVSYSENNNATLKVCLVDFANDGYPFLMTIYQSNETDFDFYYSHGLENFVLSSVCDVWGFENGKAVKYDLDTINVNIYDNSGNITYSRASSLSTDICTINGKTGIRLYQQFGQWEMGPYAYVYYIVENGKLTKFHTITHHFTDKLEENNNTYFYAYALPNVKNTNLLGNAANLSSFDLYSNFITAPTYEFEKADWLKNDYGYYCYEVDGAFYGKKKLNNSDSIEEFFNINISSDNIYTGINTNWNITPYVNSKFPFNSKSYTLNVLDEFSNCQLYDYLGYNYKEISKNLSNEELKSMAKTIDDTIDGDLGYVFSIADGFYYIVTFENDNPLSGALLQKTLTGYKQITKDENFIDNDLLEKTVQILSTKSNINLKYTSAGKNKLDYFKNNVVANPNDAEKKQIASYIQSVVKDSSTINIINKNNSLILTQNMINESILKAQKSKQDYDNLLQNITLNKTIPIDLRIVCKSMESNKPMQVVLNDKVNIDECDNIEILLGDSRHSITINSSNLNNLIDTYGSVSIQIDKARNNLYTIYFKSNDGKVIDKLDSPVSISLPAENSNSTVMITYSQGVDNWGGQYDDNSRTISFKTPYSGEYKVNNESLNISDINNLDKNTQNAIEFMVSKGYFSLDENNNFNPQYTLTRYDFAKTLVGMFFALDSTLKTSFSDVKGNSKYYPYVASGENDNIIKGFDDKTFRGENTVSKEEVIAFCGRTLAEQKEYTYPNDKNMYLKFTDSDSISTWALDTVALSVREKLIENSGQLNPQSPITRAESAKILYNLFMLLYEIPETEIYIDEKIDKTPFIITALSFIGITGGLMKNKFKKSKNKEG